MSCVSMFFFPEFMFFICSDYLRFSFSFRICCLCFTDEAGPRVWRNAHAFARHVLSETVPQSKSLDQTCASVQGVISKPLIPPWGPEETTPHAKGPGVKPLLTPRGLECAPEGMEQGANSSPIVRSERVVHSRV